MAICSHAQKASEGLIILIVMELKKKPQFHENVDMSLLAGVFVSIFGNWCPDAGWWCCRYFPFVVFLIVSWKGVIRI